MSNFRNDKGVSKHFFRLARVGEKGRRYIREEEVYICGDQARNKVRETAKYVGVSIVQSR